MIVTKDVAFLGLSKRARRAINATGSIEQIAELIKFRETRKREERWGGGEYTLGGWWRCLPIDVHGFSNVTRAELTAACLTTGLVTWEDCNFEQDESLQNKRLINAALLKLGWTGRMHSEQPKSFRDPDRAAKTLVELRARRDRITRQLGKLDADISKLETVIAQGVDL